MPELPDVETFRAMVQKRFLNDCVSNVIVADPQSLEGTTEAVSRRRLRGRDLRGTDRHGKYLFLDFGEDNVVAMHFGPAGSLARVPRGEEEPAYVRVRLDFASGDGLAYVNRRRIGRVRLIANVEDFVRQAKLGPDALDPGLDFSKFAKRLAGGAQAIKVFLTDQSKISGIGNTWSDEILFQARLHPAIAARSLDEPRARLLYRVMREVSRTAIDRDPTSDDFRERLPAGFLLPHRHPGGHCPRCGTALERIAVGGRAGTFCPRCQSS